VGKPARGVIRVLGARELLQAALTGARPTRSVLAVGAVIDGLHAVSMLLLGITRREWRAPALVDAAAAAALGLLGAAAAGLRDAGSGLG
jgi:hypothetical protein